MKECGNIKVPCPLRCVVYRGGEESKRQLFSRGEELKKHLKESCPNMSVTCAKCDSEVAMSLKKQHDCVKSLRGVISHYARIIS